jgi:uncharacterized membrane protein
MNQSADRADRADNQTADQAVQHGVTEQPGRPGTPPQEPPEKHLWTLFQVDQQRISALDTIAMTIRGWMVTLVAAIVGFSLSQHHRNLLLVAMVGAAFFGVLDVEYRHTQLLHAKRANKVERKVAQNYRLRPDKSGKGSPWLTLIRGRYSSSILFYIFVLIFLLILWAAS